jgi:hypothetical protein
MSVVEAWIEEAQEALFDLKANSDPSSDDKVTAYARAQAYSLVAIALTLDQIGGYYCGHGNRAAFCSACKESAELDHSW